MLGRFVSDVLPVLSSLGSSVGLARLFPYDGVDETPDPLDPDPTDPDTPDPDDFKVVPGIPPLLLLLAGLPASDLRGGKDCTRWRMAVLRSGSLSGMMAAANQEPAFVTSASSFLRAPPQELIPELIGPPGELSLVVLSPYSSRSSSASIKAPSITAAWTKTY